MTRGQPRALPGIIPREQRFVHRFTYCFRCGKILLHSIKDEREQVFTRV